MIYVQCKLIRYRHALKHLEVFQDTSMYCIGKQVFTILCLHILMPNAMPSEDKIKLSLIY